LAVAQNGDLVFGADRKEVLRLPLALVPDRDSGRRTRERSQ
jgi:hypothetical protein